ncbi:MAG: PIN domain-containing protein [Enhydrobacter sp.]|nr:PIN domain-containing protein [Enhydrobacter sp.]
MAEFIDSNILVYAFAFDERSAAAEVLLQRRPVISEQSLNEFMNVARRKLGMNWDELRGALAVIRDFCPVILSLDIDTHENAVRLAERYGFATFDALIVASALQSSCRVLWSEDMQHGMLIDGRLRIANPFRTES